MAINVCFQNGGDRHLDLNLLPVLIYFLVPRYRPGFNLSVPICSVHMYVVRLSEFLMNKCVGLYILTAWLSR